MLSSLRACAYQGRCPAFIPVWGSRLPSFRLQSRLQRQGADPRQARPALCNYFRTTAVGASHHDAETAVPNIEQEVTGSLCRAIAPRLDPATKEIILVLGVSGGCDSVGLLHAVVNITRSSSSASPSVNSLQCSCGERTLSCHIHVAHFDHQLRGEESDGDRLFVEKLCRDFGLPFHCYYWSDDNCQPTTEAKPFSQDLARRWRRSRTTELLSHLGSTHSEKPRFVLTAHHADDSTESLLLKLIRGAHITNMQGMDPVSQDEDGTWILRPLLGVSKRAIKNYLQEGSLVWREDSSNASNKYLRNQVRNELIPLLSGMMGDDEILRRRIENLSQQSSEVRRDLDTRASRFLQESCLHGGCFKLLSSSSALELVHKEALHLWVGRETGGYQFTYKHSERVWDHIIKFPDRLEWKINIGGGWDVVREGTILRVVSSNNMGENEDETSDVVARKKLKWSPLSQGNPNNLTRNVLGVVISPETLRAADSFILSTVGHENLPFTPPWRKGRSPSKASRFLRGQGIPLYQRRQASIVYAQGKHGGKTAVALKNPLSGEWVHNAAFVCDSALGGNISLAILLSD